MEDSVGDNIKGLGVQYKFSFSRESVEILQINFSPFNALLIPLIKLSEPLLFAMYPNALFFRASSIKILFSNAEKMINGIFNLFASFGIIKDLPDWVSCKSETIKLINLFFWIVSIDIV